ncbi:MAG: bifunctional phosphopantothenoylcysteine decarboxylase/phosphopantothenate--cysteine ligase CoaBC [Desulfitobacteriia bacterium]|jgi:phosphopantothenoylcysteine decarboxylase/phosphopantothenate--cysteine ligase
MFDGKRILLGVTGGIAAYKSVEIVSSLRQLGSEIKVIMTEAATKFVTPLTFQRVAAGPVYIDMFAEPKTWDVEHISLAKWADVVLVAPASANTLAKMAFGIADNQLSTTLLATKAPIFVAPAMNPAMYQNPATQKNIELLKERGVRFIGPDRGFLACGDQGEGRMSEPEFILAELKTFFASNRLLQGSKVLVTAGGTRELLDPVRYLGNLSSGKMGYAIAGAFAEAGAEVTLISAPTALPAPAGVKLINVVSALEMQAEVLKVFEEQDIVVKAAAVADYRPANYQEQKIKKKGQNLTVELIPNPDILKSLGERKKHQFLVGFAAETQNAVENAFEKMKRKNADMLVVNDVTLPGAGFGTDTNIVSFLFADGNRIDLPKMSKTEVARALVKEIVALRKQQ